MTFNDGSKSIEIKFELYLWHLTLYTVEDTLTLTHVRSIYCNTSLYVLQKFKCSILIHCAKIKQLKIHKKVTFQISHWLLKFMQKVWFTSNKMKTTNKTKQTVEFFFLFRFELVKEAWVCFFPAVPMMVFMSDEISCLRCQWSLAFFIWCGDSPMNSIQFKW